MSVTGYMYNINATKKLGELEIKEGLEGNRSWHHQFRNSAYVYIGGLHQGLTEGDVAIMFAQFGEIVDVNLVRDKSTGKSKGFAFLCYEDQRSTILAVDNMNGYQLLSRTLRVDHVDKYKAPKVLDEEEKDENGDPKLLEYKATGAEGVGSGAYNVLPSQRKIAEVQEQRRAKPAGQAPPEDEDEAWAKAFEDGLRAQAASGGKSKKKKKKKMSKKKMKEKFKKELEELKRMKMETKRLKNETKKAKEALKARNESGKARREQGVTEDKQAKRKKPEPEQSSEGDSDSSEGSSDESSEDSERSDDKKKRKTSRR